MLYIVIMRREQSNQTLLIFGLPGSPPFASQRNDLSGQASFLKRGIL